MPAPDRTRTAPTRPEATPPLSKLLAHTARAVADVQAGRSLNDALAACPGPLRPGVQALSFAAMRRLGLARHLRARLVNRTPAPWVDALVLTALALACGDEYSEFTLVDQAVNAARRQAPQAAGMVNAVLRRFLREKADLLADAANDPVARWNHPAWWIARVKADWPDHWQAVLASGQEAGPMVLRVNRRAISRQAWLDQFTATGRQARAWGTDGVVLDDACPVQQLPGFAQGQVSVQDSSAQQAAALLLGADGLALPPGARVLDACSAPGGKTAHLLEMADLAVLALDADPQRLPRVTDTLQRLALTAQVRAADAARPADWWDGRPFDAILLDAPCSASGIVRRHPDARWLRRETDIRALADIQKALLEALWPLLAPGGRLLYATCSVFREEGQAQVDAFLQRHPEAQTLPSPGHLLPVVEYPDAPEPAPLVGDGFFYCLLSKP